MDERNLIEITKSTIEEVDRILRLDNSNYVKEFGCEAERTDKAKIEKVVNMVSTLSFFIDKYYDLHGGTVNKAAEPAEEKKLLNEVVDII